MNEFRFKVSLRFFSQVVDPNEICEKLKMEPEWKHKIGDPRTTPKGITLDGFYDTSYCSFLITPRKNEELHDVIERIVTDLQKHESLFCRIREDGGCIEFFVGWFSTGNSGETFSSDLLRKLGKLQIDLSLDVYGDKKK